jgi:hypothetical protein
MIQWAWSYLTFERGARLITGSSELPGGTAAERNEAQETVPHRRSGT